MSTAARPETQAAAQNFAALLSAANVTRVTLPFSVVKPHPRNYHKHPQTQIAKLIKSFKRFGQYRAFVCIEDKAARGSYITVAGHGSIEAAKQAGFTEGFFDLLPIDTPQEVVLGILLADNLLERLAMDDTQELMTLLEEQFHLGVDLDSVGSSEEELNEMLEEAAGALDNAPDEFEEYGEDIEVKHTCPKCGYQFS